MASVQFEEIKYEPINKSAIKNPFLIRLVLGTGLLKTRKQAEILLLIISLIILFFSAKYIISFKENNTPRVIYREDISLEARATLPPDILAIYPSKFIK